MLIRITSQELSESLNYVTRAIAARPSKPVLEGILIETKEDGISLTCTDGALTICAKAFAQIERQGQTVIPGKILAELVRKLPQGMVEISVNEKNMAAITCMSSRTGLTCMSPIDFPLMQAIDNGQTVSLPQNKLKDMIQRVSFAIATDESRQILTGCLLEVTPSETRLVGLDGFRLALQRYEGPFVLPEDVTKLQAVIPGKVLNELSKILSDEDDPIELTFDKSRLYATFGNTAISSVLLAGEYINYKQILPADWKTRIKINRNDLNEAIDRASLMAREGKNNLLKLQIDDFDMNITSNAEMGDVKETISIQLEGLKMEIAFNARYLSDVIRNIGDEYLCMRFNSNVSPCVICPPEGEKYTYLVLPVRVF